MEVWILVFIIVGILKLIPAPKNSAQERSSRHHGMPWISGNRRKATKREIHGLPWMDSNYKKRKKRKERNSYKF